MVKRPDAQAFLAAMSATPDAEEAPQARVAAQRLPAAEVHTLPKQPRPPKAAARTKLRRAELKHFGGYVDDDTLEKIALLRVRLKKDNSELITFAIEELHRKHNAKRAFGDS